MCAKAIIFRQRGPTEKKIDDDDFNSKMICIGSTEFLFIFSCVCTVRSKWASKRVSEWVRACMCSYVFTGVYFVLGSPFHIRACNEHTPANVCERVSECCVVEYCTHIAKSPIIKYHGVIAVVVVVVVVVLIVVVIVIVVGSSCFNHHSFPVSEISTQTHTQMPAFLFILLLLLLLRLLFVLLRFHSFFSCQKESTNYLFLFRLQGSSCIRIHNTIHRMHYNMCVYSAPHIGRIALFS